MKPEVAECLHKPEFPRSRGYDAGWMMDNQMGPNALWLAEWLNEGMTLTPGMRVLDLGCGRAMSSVFLAREFGVQVWAADLWISPDHNWRRACEAGVEHLLTPLRLEAHALPFPGGFFDAVISIDAYQYFGTDMLYLAYLSRFLREGGEIGIVVPALMRDIDEVPAHLATPQSNGKVFWEDECWSFRTADWWRRQWSRSGVLQQLRVDTLPDGWRHWMDFEKALELSGKNIFPSEAEALEADGGSTIGFVRAIGARKPGERENLYDATLGARAGVDA
jgi:cyclopropane fatty-acyl-phospholipid synthase-like methyltransferase